MSDAPDTTTVRLAMAADVPALEALIAASVRALSVGYYTPEQIESALRFVFGVDSQLISDETYYVVDGPDGPAACGGWSRRATLYGGDRHKGATDPLLDPAAAPARIRAFFVHPAWARRGLATRLLATSASAAAAAGFRDLELAATLPGEPLYAALGFVAHERSSVTLPDGVALPIVRMTRPIGAAGPGAGDERVVGRAASGRASRHHDIRGRSDR
ncbi:MAG TPA: GNAT family N-acetyltransferase [Gemmatimonadaceae bacterium]